MSKDKKIKNEGHFGGKPGFKNPPKNTQFKTGQSGNPKGRPPKEVVSVKSVLEEIMLTKEDMIINGKRVKMARIEALILKSYEDAIKSGRYHDKRILMDALKKGGFFDNLDDLYLPF